MKTLKKKSMKMILMLTFIPALMISLTGCRSVVLHPIEAEHIQSLDAGQQFTAPRAGYFLSDDYLKKVLKAKVTQF